jgi:putative oxidoreductase
MLEKTPKFQAILDRLSGLFNLQDYFLLFVRLWVGKVFYLSGRSKVGDGFFSPSDLTISLFEDEYALPLLDASFAAQLAVYAETFFPLMLMLGLGARIGALGLLGMTAVIQIFVYPGYFPEHLTWVAALLPVLMLGGGRLSVDHLLVHHSRH